MALTIPTSGAAETAAAAATEVAVATDVASMAAKLSASRPSGGGRGDNGKDHSFSSFADLSVELIGVLIFDRRGELIGELICDLSGELIAELIGDFSVELIGELTCDLSGELTSDLGEMSIDSGYGDDAGLDAGE